MVETSPVLQTSPEEIIQGYPWPSSKLTKADMIRLTDLRERLQTPITELLHEAVGAYYRLLVTETANNEQEWHRKLKGVPTSDLVAELNRRRGNPL